MAERRADVLGVDHSEVRAAADGAHVAWLRIDDEATALRLAVSVVSIRERIPGPDRTALTSARRRAARLSSDGPETLPYAS